MPAPSAGIGGARRSFRIFDVPLPTGGVAGFAIDVDELEQAQGRTRRFQEAQRAMLDRLSAGTADQVYLLLRVALAQHLATTGETCPLLLDGVTAQSDDERTRELARDTLRFATDLQRV